MTYISWFIEFAFYHCHRLKLFVYIKKWRRPLVFLPLQAHALVVSVLLVLFTPLFCVLYGAMQWCLSQSFTVSHCICFSSSAAVYSPVLCSVWCDAAMSVTEFYCKPLYFVSVLLLLFTPLFYVLYGVTQRCLSQSFTVSHCILFQFFCCCLLPCSMFCMVLHSDVCRRVLL